MLDAWVVMWDCREVVSFEEGDFDNIKLNLIEKARRVPETAMKSLNNDEKEKFFALMSKLIENLNDKLN